MAAEIAKTIRVIMAKALNTMRICVYRGPAGANRRTEERTLRLSPLGNIATRSAAIVVGIPMVPSFGSASIKAVSRTTAVSLGLRSKLNQFDRFRPMRPAIFGLSPAALFDRRQAGPMLLRNGVSPCRA
jgi:hypothetical protein